MNPEIISHRINTIEGLKKTSTAFGAEIDIRSDGSRLILHHDPFSQGEDLEEWLKSYQHGTLILNVKEEGLEESLINLMNKFRVDKYFFLDLSFPYLVKMMRKGCQSIAVRFSEYESIETVMTLKGAVQWVWIDCFTRLPLEKEDYQRLKKAEFKLCLVSPELVHEDELAISRTKAFLKEHHFNIDAVCTKDPQQWLEDSEAHGKTFA